MRPPELFLKYIMKKINEKKVIRIIDANVNRACEGVRVCEEVVRFVLDSRQGSSDFKNIRHKISQAVDSLPLSYSELIESRESANDAGKDLAVFRGEKTKLENILIANMKRAQEAVRVLEEFSKIISRDTSALFQEIRFDLYQLEKKIICEVCKK